MARRPPIEAAIAPGQVVRPRERAPIRLVLILLLLNVLLGSVTWYYLTEISPSAVDLLWADTPVDVLFPGETKPRKLTTAVDLPEGTVVATRSVPRTALHFSSVTVRLAAGTKVRILQGGPLAASGVELSLEAGRLWVDRGSQWVPVVVRVGPERLRPGVGNTEIRREPLVVLGWTATLWVEDEQETRLFQVDLGEGGQRTDGRWRHVPLPGLVDPWTAWNMHTNESDLLTGNLMDMKLAHRLERPAEYQFTPPQRPAPFSPRPRQGEVAHAREPGPPSRTAPGVPPLPGLPGPDYPTRGSAAGYGGGHDPGPYAPGGSGEPQGWEDEDPPDPPPGPAGPRRRSQGQLTWQAPDGLSTSGRDEPPKSGVSPTSRAASVRDLEEARKIQERLENVLAGRFGMELRQPFLLKPAGPGDADVAPRGNRVRPMALKEHDGGWVAKVVEGVPADEFAVWGAALYTKAWLQEQGLDEDRDAPAFTHWMAYKFAVAAGLKEQARSLPHQVDPNTPWEGAGFQELWDLESTAGERGVFDRLLEAEEYQQHDS